MQTNLVDSIKNTPDGQEADAILRSCVHCGFCIATCPTYQLLGDELDGPRGRIYLIKQVLEGNAVTQKTQQHLDRCLSCRACETTCPSGVRYGQLLDIGRHRVEHTVRRSVGERLTRFILRLILPYPKRVKILLKIGQTLRPGLPRQLKQKIPPPRHSKPWPTRQLKRKMLLLDGCVQPITAANINAAAARVFDKLGVTLIRPDNAGCCGAISHHLSAQQEALDFMRQNIDAWWPAIDSGEIEAIVTTASGCGLMVSEYGHLLRNDPIYAEKAARVSVLTKDISEILINLDISSLEKHRKNKKVAFHSPCTLQHGQKITGIVETVLLKAGYTLTTVPNSHLCCGSAGTYSLLQPLLSQQLLHNKLASLEADNPDLIASANIGCQLHLETQSRTPVKHWIELLEI